MGILKGSRWEIANNWTRAKRPPRARKKKERRERASGNEYVWLCIGMKSQWMGSGMGMGSRREMGNRGGNEVSGPAPARMNCGCGRGYDPTLVAARAGEARSVPCEGRALEAELAIARREAVFADRVWDGMRLPIAAIRRVPDEIWVMIFGGATGQIKLATLTRLSDWLTMLSTGSVSTPPGEMEHAAGDADETRRRAAGLVLLDTLEQSGFGGYSGGGHLHAAEDPEWYDLGPEQDLLREMIVKPWPRPLVDTCALKGTPGNSRAAGVDTGLAEEQQTAAVSAFDGAGVVVEGGCLGSPPGCLLNPWSARDWKRCECAGWREDFTEDAARTVSDEAHAELKRFLERAPLLETLEIGLDHQFAAEQLIQHLRVSNRLTRLEISVPQGELFSAGLFSTLADVAICPSLQVFNIPPLWRRRDWDDGGEGSWRWRPCVRR
ncbi:hypothetical protein DFH09DRAFT_1104667 [Mycena vulgaris]|nr:hypothetical protein DFH09DRAFT_1104667 [Mycena vulgaris]